MTGAKKEGTSKIMREKQRLETQRGELKNDGKNWTPENDDQLLDLWLQGRGLKTIASLLDRPIETIKNRVWKIVHSYRGINYKPGPSRINRDKLSVTKREQEIIQQHTSGKITLEHLSNVLARSRGNILSLSQKPPRKGFFDGPKPEGNN